MPREKLQKKQLDFENGKMLRIIITFNRGDRFIGSLPEYFDVKRIWYRHSTYPDEKNSLEWHLRYGKLPTKNIGSANRSLQRYLNKIHFEYVPAIKDKDYLNYILNRLQDTILENQSRENEFKNAVINLNDKVQIELKTFVEEFAYVTGIKSNIGLSTDVSEVFNSFNVSTDIADSSIPIDSRGDGIRMRIIPSLLNYISENSPYNYIWGFEEPENCMENKFATELAQKFENEYSNKAQIFITSHSPAFYGLRRDRTNVYRVFLEQDEKKLLQTRSKIIDENSLIDLGELDEELGLMGLRIEQQKQYQEKVDLISSLNEVISVLKDEIATAGKPVLLTEGKWDVKILEEAWTRIRIGVNCPFKILSCATTPEDGSGGGGATTLVGLLNNYSSSMLIIIGLFDRDHGGIKKGFNKLNKNFLNFNNESNIKVQKNGACGAILLPIVSGREKYAEKMNFMIEFYFSDEYLEYKVDGKGLELEYPHIELKLHGSGIDLGTKRATETYLRQIKMSSKKHFAEKVVPTLPNEAFENFKLLFDKIEYAILELQKIRNKHKK